MYKILFKFLLGFILLLGIQNNAFADRYIDSLMLRLKMVPDTSKAKIYNDLSMAETSYSMDKSIEYANKALEMATKYDNQTETMYAYDGLGYA